MKHNHHEDNFRGAEKQARRHFPSHKPGHLPSSIRNGGESGPAGAESRKATLHGSEVASVAELSGTFPPTDSAEDFDDGRPDAEALQASGSGGGAGMLSNQQRLELSQTSERNKHFLNPIESVWPSV